ncbi:MAG: 4Fe-4S binding protein [Flavobacteriia bacterium]|nr:4Fe-4S binding protein [Flavobacteriia bacterium]
MRQFNFKSIKFYSKILIYLGISFLIYSLFIKNKSLSLIGLSILFSGFVLYSIDSKEQIKSIFQISNPFKINLLSFLVGSIPFGIFFLNWLGFSLYSFLYFFIFIFSIFISILLLFLPQKTNLLYQEKAVFFHPLKNASFYSIVLAVLFFIFYIQLYWYPDYLKNISLLFNPLSQWIRNKPADQWFLYGTIYTIGIVYWGIKFIQKHKHQVYQKWRTLSLIFSQVVFAYFIPSIMEAFSLNSSLDQNDVYLGYFNANPINSWPLNYDFFSGSHLEAYVQKTYQPYALSYFIWGLVLFLVLTPVFTYFVGKRWYCSWLCSCGGLAETVGDSFRHLSDKTFKSWKIERIVIHTVLLFVSIMTIAVLLSYFSGKNVTIVYWTVNKTTVFISISLILILMVYFFYFLYKKSTRSIFILMIGLIITILLFLFIAYFSGNSQVFIVKSSFLKKSYGFLIGAIFSGILGVGLYPILGSRFWCRFGCPMASYMGIFQRFFSRFQITVNGNQCISCGNCSVYCEQGIDVRSYAQQGLSFTRSSCVGCGMCATVCPRGVLKLENVRKKETK